MNSYDLHGRAVANSFHPEVTYRNFDRIENLSQLSWFFMVTVIQLRLPIS